MEPSGDIRKRNGGIFKAKKERFLKNWFLKRKSGEN